MLEPPALPDPPADETVPLLRLTGLTKRFGAHEAVADVSLDLGAGEFFCLLGPSGCGKSTLLRLVAGFEVPDAGMIRLGGTDLTGRPPHRRPLNMMFQSYALFPHMSVADNVAFGLEGLGLGRAAIAARVTDLLRLVRLDGFAARFPEKLSGGQRQRVALARALAREPRVLLLDEPLGALDRTLREQTQAELRSLQRRLGTTFVVVTHDAAEAMTLADRIGVMDRGRLVQVGDAASLYDRPANPFVATLLGDVNLIEGRVGAREPGGLVSVETALGAVLVRAADPLEHGAAGCLAIRPERFAISAADAANPANGNAFIGSVGETTFLGDRVRLQVRMANGIILRASVPARGAEAGFVSGDAVRLAIAPDGAVLLAP